MSEKGTFLHAGHHDAVAQLQHRRLMDSRTATLDEQKTERLSRVADEVECRNPGSWLAPMLREYLRVRG